jgi:hypothetical protein
MKNKFSMSSLRHDQEDQAAAVAAAPWRRHCTALGPCSLSHPNSVKHSPSAPALLSLCVPVLVGTWLGCGPWTGAGGAKATQQRRKASAAQTPVRSSSSSSSRPVQKRRGTHHNAKGSTQGSTGIVRGSCCLTRLRVSVPLFLRFRKSVPLSAARPARARRGRWSGQPHRPRQQAGAVGVPPTPLPFLSASPSCLLFPCLLARRWRRPSFGALCAAGAPKEARGARAREFAYTSTR